jgi:hypothetical protein
MAMVGWKEAARQEVFEAAYLRGPDARPLFKVRRHWWQFWAPKFQMVEGVSRADLQRAHNAAQRLIMEHVKGE